MASGNNNSNPKPKPVSTSSSSVTAYPSVASYCPQLKVTYETCFQKWYTDEFLNMTASGSKLPCEKEYEEYRTCVMKAVSDLGLLPDLPMIDPNKPGELNLPEKKKK